jgi:hypothetical protein
MRILRVVGITVLAAVMTVQVAASRTEEKTPGAAPNIPFVCSLCGCLKGIVHQNLCHPLTGNDCFTHPGISCTNYL